MREPPFNHLDSTSSESTFHCILAHNYHISLCAGQQGERCSEPMSALRSPTGPSQRHCAPPTSHLSSAEVSSTPRHAIPRLCAQECFPCVLRNHFSMHSPCSSFAVALTGEGGRRSDDNDGGDGPAATAPALSAKGGRDHLRATSLLLRVPEGRAASLTLEALLSLADDDGDNSRGRGRGIRMRQRRRRW